MPVGLDFANLDLQDALDLAILIEVEAMERYKLFSEQLGRSFPGDPASVFAMMAVNEKKHADELEERRQQLFGSAPRRVSPDALYDVEAPNVGAIRWDMSVRHAYEIALSSEPPTTIMLVGLQGSGKTTAAAKLARRLVAKGKKGMLIAADIYRPAAIEQLETLARSVPVDVYYEREEGKAADIVQRGMEQARGRALDFVIVDTAGRLHIDEEMMDEVRAIRDAIEPDETVLVADGMTGQDAVTIAGEFSSGLGIDGVILTKMDGDERGGAALSIKAVSGAPIRYIGVGEKLDALEVFHPERMASRILGMGDVLTLVERAQDTIDEKEAEKLQKKILKETFSLEDFLDQIKQVKKMGPLEDIMGLIPGMSKMKGINLDERAMVRVEAIISSMTREERLNPDVIDGSRRKRIAAGSGTRVQDVNRVLRDFQEVRKLFRNIKKGKLSGLMRSFLTG